MRWQSRLARCSAATSSVSTHMPAAPLLIMNGSHGWTRTDLSGAESRPDHSGVRSVGAA
jgi:hypothetical protein